MMGEVVARNMQSKANAENKNAIVASCWTYFTAIKMDVQEVGCEGMDWIDLAQSRDRWWALVNAVMNLRVP